MSEVVICPACVGSGYGGHPDSGAICVHCGGSGGVKSDSSHIALPEEMIAQGLQHYSEGGCLCLDQAERREVVISILSAALGCIDAKAK